MKEKTYGINCCRHLNMPGYEEQTTYMNDFAIAERFGEAAIKDTFARCIDQHRALGVEYLAELCLVMNALCWHFWEQGNSKYSELYGELYHRCMDRAYSEGELDEDERRYFFKVTD